MSNAHVYDIHYGALDELVKRETKAPPVHIKLPPHTFERAEQGEQELVTEISDQLLGQYHPLDPIKGLNIVL